jgi:endonuclease/exonuclease/phosphatase (EEP) superfamily protein YafD
MILRVAFIMALLAATAATAVGMLAPLYPPADFINHFRPFILAAAGLLLLAALALRARRPAWWVGAVAGLNAVLLLLPLAWSADLAEWAAVGQAQASPPARTLKIVTFNTAYGDARAVARFLLREDPDIVVLQEVGAGHVASLRMLLRDTYPHAHSCAGAPRCDAAIFAKRPWVASGQESSASQTPEAVWVQFDDAEMGRLRVVGVHLHLPFSPATQTRQIDWMIAQRAAFAGPAIVAGDFNMTPWSYRQQRLLAATGLRRHATFLRSWPTRLYPHRRFRLPAPAFLIDHVLSTPDIRSVSIRTGPVVGSDHLPVIAQVSLPR